MARKRRPEDLSEKELRRLLMLKGAQNRRARLDHFRQTGRIHEVPRSEESNEYEVELEPPVEKSMLEDTAPVSVSKRKRFVDQALLLVEIAAIVGLIYIAFNGVSLVRELNREVSEAMQLPELTATPLITAVVLPSGHTPPTDPGGARPNEAEIPEHLRPLVQAMPAVDLPTPSPEQAVRIQIPAIGVDHPVVQGDGWEQLKKGVGQHLGTADPGQPGNMVLSAHNDIFGEIFRYLDQLSPGDEIIIYTNLRSYTYVVRTTLVVEPTFVQVMASTASPTVTLISCYPYLIDTERIVIQADLKEG